MGKTSFKPHVVCTDEQDNMFANGYEAFEGKGFEYKPMQYAEPDDYSDICPRSNSDREFRNDLCCGG